MVGQAASIVPWSVAEKWMANAARQQGINIQINYSQQAIVFGAARKVDMKSMRQPLIEIGAKLQQAMQRVAPEEQHKKEKLEKQQLSQNIVAHMEKESKLIRQRKEEIERRKEESEKRREIERREAEERQRQVEAREAEQERQRQEEDRRYREKEKAEMARKARGLEKNKETLKTIKQTAGDMGNTKLVVGGKKIAEITEDDLHNISAEQIEAAREGQLKRDRQEKIRQRKLESKRVDHLARAMREEERPKIAKWSTDIEKEDNAKIDKAEANNANDQLQKHKELLAERDLLKQFQAAKDEWVNERMEKREEEHNEVSREREYRLQKKVAAMKIERAKERMMKERKRRDDARAAKKKERGRRTS